MKDSQTIILISSIIIFIILIIFFLLKKRERYQPITQDVKLYVMLPYLTLPDLVKYSKVGQEEKEMVEKFVKRFLKVDNLCDLRGMRYYTTEMGILSSIYPPPVKGGKSKPFLGLNEIKKMSLDLLHTALGYLNPPLQFLNNVEGEWVMYNDFGSLGENYLEKGVNDIYPRLPNDVKYWVSVSERDTNLFSELQVWVGDNSPIELLTYFTQKFQEWKNLKGKYTLPIKYGIQRDTEDGDVDTSDISDSDEDEGKGNGNQKIFSFKKLAKDTGEFNNGTFFTFRLFLKIYPKKNTIKGYNKYVEYLSGLDDMKELLRELDELFSDSD